MRLTEAEAAARRGVRDVLADVPTGAPVVVGLSGGADSLALAAAVTFVAAREGLAAEAVVVDHGLQDASADVAEQAARQARALGLAARTVQVEVGTSGGPEAAARSARREALLDAAGPDGVVLLGHTRDDQAESVLLGLGRGSGGRSLAGMRTVDGPWRRPLLALSRADTETVCRAHDLTWWADPHNADPRFRRSRLRTEVMPLLEDVLGRGVGNALARTADLLRDDADLLDHLAAQVDHPSDVAVLAALPPALRSRVLRREALAAGAGAAETGAVHVAALDRLVTRWTGQDRVELPGGVCCRREGSSLIFGPTPVAG